MTNRILFVDDEQSLLNGIERRLGATFNLVTANSGAAALGAMDSGEQPFAVAVTDMRMPKMDGLQFIKAAREKSPDTVYIMLTGNQDQATAIQALNEGHVFRFLTKPCQSAELIKAVEAGVRQNQLVTSEKELLQNTFCGAVAVLTDVLELSHPNIFNRTERIQEIVHALQNSLRLEDHWEFKLAGRLSLLGFALLPDDERNRAGIGPLAGPGPDERFRNACAAGRRLIERIPRLATVAKIIGMQPDVDGSAIIQVSRTEEAKAVMGATLLRVAVLWDGLARQGLNAAEATLELRRVLPNVSPEMVDALAELPADDEYGEIVDVSISDLTEGMILADDVVSANGNMLIRKGRRLTLTIIERLRQTQPLAEPMPAIRVRATTIHGPKELAMA